MASFANIHFPQLEKKRSNISNYISEKKVSILNTIHGLISKYCVVSSDKFQIISISFRVFDIVKRLTFDIKLEIKKHFHIGGPY